MAPTEAKENEVETSYAAQIQDIIIHENRWFYTIAEGS